MVPAKIQLAKQTPGLYLFIGKGLPLFLRVDTDGIVWQVNSRSGISITTLNDAGWLDDPMTQDGQVFRLEPL